MNIKKILKELTLEEKASLCSGADFWHTKAIERLAIPQIMVSDGPHGLRKNAEDSSNPQEAIKAVCFPTASALACSFDRNLLTAMGKALGEECQAEKVSVILGPGCNIKRSPLCGRNFEYFSEDPYLASEMAAAHIKGVQSKGVGTSLKHFAAYNQETRRLTINERIDERTLHEIYLAAFEGAVKQASPWTVMCSYNRINGYHSAQNKWLLTDVLRNEWGYDGLVMSDWGAVDDRVEGIKAGLDLEMPASFGKNDRLIVDAVNSGKLSMKALDKCVERVLKLVDKAEESRTPTEWDMEAHHELAAKIAEQCAVLLKNDDAILPLSKEDKVCFIGEFAEKPRYQGGGSSHINSFKVTSALDAVKEYCKVEYAQGFITYEDRSDPKLLEQAVECAKYNDKVVIFAGLPDSFESEGFDRTHMRMPECQLELIREISKVNKNIDLTNGSTRLMYYNWNTHDIFPCDSSITARDVVRSLLEVCGCLYKLDRYGKPKFLYPTMSALYPSNTLYPADDLYPRGSNGDILPMAKYSSFDYEDYMVQNIGRIQIVKKQTSDSTKSICEWEYEGNPDAINTYLIDDNIFYCSDKMEYEYDSMAEVSEMLVNMYSRISNMKYTPHLTKALGMPWIEVGDRIGLLTTSGGIESFIYRRTLKGVQVLNDTYEAEGDEYTEKVKDYNYKVWEE